ncbi:hypothetical protein HN51_039490 [Arachis hypogaea]
MQRPTQVSLLGGFSKLSMNAEQLGAGSTGESFRIANENHNNLEIGGTERKTIGESSLQELNDNEILTITYNGRSMEGRVGDMIEGGKNILCFGQNIIILFCEKKKTSLKKLARRKGGSSGG